MSIRSEFQSHQLNPDGVQRVHGVKEVFSDALSRLEALVPPGRERSIVVTHLQQACMMAVRGVSVHPGNQLQTEPQAIREPQG